MDNYMNPYMNNYMTRMNQNLSIIWVQGIEGAKAYQMPPNSQAVLLDNDNEGVMYIKICDNVGMCTLRIFDYVERTTKLNNSVEIDTSQFVRRDELKSIIEQMVKGESIDEQSVSTTKSNQKRKLITE